MNLCNEQSQLTGYLLGELPKPEAEALEAHLAACPECCAAAEALRATLALLRDTLAPAAGAEPAMVLDAARRQRLLAVRPERAPNLFSRWLFTRHPSLAAAAEIVAVLGIIAVLLAGLFPATSNGVRKANRYARYHAVNSESELSLSSVSDEKVSRDESCLKSEDSYAAGMAVETPALLPPAPARVRPEEPQPSKQDIDADGWADAKDALQKTLPEGKTRLKIALPKPVFSGTPKDINADYARMVDRERKEEGLAKPLSREVCLESPRRPGGPRPPGAESLARASEESENARVLGLRTDKAAAAPVTAAPPASGPAAADSPARVRSPVNRRISDKLTTSESKPTDGRNSGLEVGKDAPVATEVGGVIRGLKKSGAGTLTFEGGNSYDYSGVVGNGSVTAVSGDTLVSSGTLVKDGGIATETKKGEAGEKENFKKTAEKPAPAAFNPFVAAAGQPFSTFAMDVDTASYTLTRQAIRSGAMPEPERVRTEEIVNAFDYGDTAPDTTVFRVYQDGAQSPFGAGYNLLRIGVKGRRLGREEQRPAMLTFVIDVSGSMAQPDRIGLARLALKLLAGQLAERDRIQIIAYSDHARLVLEPVAASEKDKVVAAFESLQCNGSTNLEEGLRQAYEQAARCFVPGAENRVILISDGVANLGADSAQEILDKVAANRKQGITCSVFGVGAGTYNDRLLEELANKGDGVYRFLDSEAEVRSAFVDDLAATLNTIAKDAKIQVEWNPAAVRQYRQLGYENRALRKEQFRDDTVDAGEVGSGQSVTALYELELAPDAAPDARLGTVRIRYQRADTGKVEEIEARLAAESVVRPAHRAGAHFRVAASAAEFAELLRGSPYAAGGSFQKAADYLRPAALELSLDTRVKELLDLITATAAIKGR